MEECKPTETFTSFQCNTTLLYLKCFMVLSQSQKPMIAVLCFCIGGLCIVENLLVLFLIFSSSKLRKKPSYILLSSLALADTLATVTFVSSFLNFHVFNMISASKEIYLLKLTGVNTSFTASLGSLFLMAFDRYICILRPSHYKQLVTRRRAVVALLVLWAAALFLSSLPLLGWNCCSLQSTCSQLFPFVADSYLSSWIILVTVLLASIIYAYMHVLWKAHQHTANMKKHHLEEFQQNPKRRLDIKLAKTLSIVLMVLVICWLPGLLLMAYSLFSIMDNFTRVAFAFCITLCLVNSMVNPAIYALRSKELSSSLRRICSFGEGVGQFGDQSGSRKLLKVHPSWKLTHNVPVHQHRNVPPFGSNSQQCHLQLSLNYNSQHSSLSTLGIPDQQYPERCRFLLVL